MITSAITPVAAPIAAEEGVAPDQRIQRFGGPSSREWHLPGYNFVGAGTMVAERMSLTYTGSTGTDSYWLPVNKLDLAAFKHDMMYYADRELVKLGADVALVNAAWRSNNKAAAALISSQIAILATSRAVFHAIQGIVVSYAFKAAAYKFFDAMRRNGIPMDRARAILTDAQIRRVGGNPDAKTLMTATVASTITRAAIEAVVPSAVVAAADTVVAESMKAAGIESKDIAPIAPRGPNRPKEEVTAEREAKEAKRVAKAQAVISGMDKPVAAADEAIAKIDAKLKALTAKQRDTKNRSGVTYPRRAAEIEKKERELLAAYRRRAQASISRSVSRGVAMTAEDKDMRIKMHLSRASYIAYTQRVSLRERELSELIAHRDAKRKSKGTFKRIVGAVAPDAATAALDRKIAEIEGDIAALMKVVRENEPQEFELSARDAEDDAKKAPRGPSPSPTPSPSPAPSAVATSTASSDDTSRRMAWLESLLSATIFAATMWYFNNPAAATYRLMRYIYDTATGANEYNAVDAALRPTLDAYDRYLAMVGSFGDDEAFVLSAAREGAAAGAAFRAVYNAYVSFVASMNARYGTKHIVPPLNEAKLGEIDATPPPSESSSPSPSPSPSPSSASASASPSSASASASPSPSSPSHTPTPASAPPRPSPTPTPTPAVAPTYASIGAAVVGAAASIAAANALRAMDAGPQSSPPTSNNVAAPAVAASTGIAAAALPAGITIEPVTLPAGVTYDSGTAVAAVTDPSTEATQQDLIVWNHFEQHLHHSGLGTGDTNMLIRGNQMASAIFLAGTALDAIFEDQMDYPDALEPGIGAAFARQRPAITAKELRGALRYDRIDAAAEDFNRTFNRTDAHGTNGFFGVIQDDAELNAWRDQYQTPPDFFDGSGTYAFQPVMPQGILDSDFHKNPLWYIVP
jgi:uncharacterized coiled-coil protein SlyX